MSVSFDPSASGHFVRDQVQVSVMKKSQELEKQSVLPLINSAIPKANESASTSANPPHIGKNLNVVA